MALSDAERDELLALMLGGEAPEILVGAPETNVGDGLWFSLPTGSGGVVSRACSPRAATLIRKYLEA